MKKSQAVSYQWIRPREQTTLTVVFSCLLLAIWGHWWLHGGTRGERVLWDRAAAQIAPYVVDINHATWPELAQLPRIGKTLAQRIVNWRLQNGPYTTLGQLTLVHGIGSHTLERLLPYLEPIVQVQGS